MSASAGLIDKLNRGVRSRHARWSFLGDQPFGAALRLRRFRLGNGLTVLTLIDRSAPTVSYHSWFRVGSRHEKVGKTGLAHLFEHLMFNQTKSHGYGEFDRQMELAGAESNAATWTDWTYYYENAPRGALPLLVELEADRMGNLVLRKPQVESEKEVVANERKQRVDDDIEGLAVERLYAQAFAKHPYRWPTIGWMTDIRAFSVEDCRKFYRAFYAPNNATVVVAGDFDERKALALIQAHYGKYRPAKLPRTKTVTEPAQRRPRREKITAPTPTDKLLVGYHVPAFAHRDNVALTVANEVLFGGKSSRAFRLLCREKEVASSVRGSVSPFKEPGLYEMWVSLREGHRCREALRLLDHLIDEMARTPVTPTEIEKAVNQLELGFLHSMETAGGKAEQVGFYETVAGDGGAVFERLEAYRRVKAVDVQRVVAKLLRPHRRTTIEVVGRAS